MLLHDLKSPLGVIQGFLTVAQSEDWYESLDRDAKNIFATLERNAVHMQDLLNELAELNHLNFQSGKPEIQEVFLPVFIREIADAAREMAFKKSINFKLECEGELPQSADFNPLKIRRVLENLLSNAIKYSTRNTTVCLAVSVQGGQLNFAITDQGLGIPEAEFSKLFKEFGKTSVRPTEGESSSGHWPRDCEENC